jgi:hypothetical protein
MQPDPTYRIGSQTSSKRIGGKMKNASYNLIGIASTIVLLGLTQPVFGARSTAPTVERQLAIGQPANGNAGRPLMTQSIPGQDQDSTSQWMRMEKMMRSQIGGTGATAATPGERTEARIAFLKAELLITDGQMADWNLLAEALRSGRHHLAESRRLAVLDDRAPSAERLDRYERHLTERLEAVRFVRERFTRLYLTLDDAQKRTADAIVIPLIATF